jgi:hypothetical protein
MYYDMTAESRNNGTGRAMKLYGTIKELLKTVFYVWSSPKSYNKDLREIRGLSRVEAGSTVTLRVVGGDEKGSPKSETVKYGRESQGTRTRERPRWQRPAAYAKDRPVLSSERAPHKNNTVTVKR